MDIPPLTEDEMSEIKKEVLTRLRPYLCDKIIADRHFDYLRSRRILTRDDTEEIYCRSTQKKKTGMLLDILAENPLGLDTLIESIQLSRSLNFIITKITDEVQKVKNERIEALRAASSSTTGYLSLTGATNDLSRTLSYESNLPSTILFHPDGEGSSSTSEALGSTSLPPASSHPKDASSIGKGSMTASSSMASSSLPKPGDPGAPPLPEELLADASASMDAGAQCSGGDANFQPLRSRSLTPHRDISPCQSYKSC